MMDWGDQSLSIDLSATSRDPFPANLTLSPTGLHDFGVIAIGGFSDLLMTVQNSGERDATGIDLSSVVAPYSVENDTCGTTLLAGSQCTFVVRFTPVAQVVSPLTFNLDYFDGVAPQSVSKSVSGEGRVAGFLSVDEGLNFDYEIVNTGFRRDQTLTIRNTGGGVASAISLSGLTVPFNGINNSCPPTLNPGNSCQVTIRFTPTSTSDFNSQLNITYSDGFVPQRTDVNFTGEGFANAPTISLFDPLASPSQDETPTFNIGNLVPNLDVRVYRNSSCTIQMASGNSTGPSLQLTPTVPEGNFNYHVRVFDSHGNPSACSTAFEPYEYDASNPNPPTNIVLAQSFTSSSTTSPNFSWTASSSGDVVDYQVGISTSAAGGNSTSGWTTKGNVTSANQGTLTLTECEYYYVSVRSVDHVGLISPTYAVSSASFRYDSQAPTAPSNLNEDGDGSINNSATVTWNPSTDACGVDHYEVAVSEDINGNNLLDPFEIGNAVPYTDVGLVTSHRFNSVTLTNGVTHFTSIRAVDTTGRFSTQSISDPWIVYDPSIELPDMIVWLDANDPSTVFDSNGRDGLHPSFNGQVDDWLDKSGSTTDHDFSSISGSARPTYNGTNFTMNFNGSTTGMTVPNHPEINTATVTQRNITVAFRTSADITTRQVLYEEGGNVRGMNIYIFNGRLYCGFYNDPGGVGGSDDPDVDQPFTHVSDTIAPNTNYFVTWVFDYTNFPAPTGDLICYLNGSTLGSTTTTSRLFAHSGAVGLGTVNGQSVMEDGSIPNSGHHFLGSLYEVMLFNNAPTAGDVTNVHTYLDNKWN
jgi:hypothetical protein